jgi:hypothetical protein
MLDRWVTKRWLVTRQANQVFLAASSLNLILVVVILCLFAGLVPWTLLENGAVRFTVGVLGGTTAIGSVILVFGMEKYWRELDCSSSPSKRFWFWVLTLGVNVGSSIYYLMVYRHLETHASGDTNVRNS